MVKQKPHRGIIYHWKKMFFPVDKVRELYGEEPGLGYVIQGFLTSPPKLGSYWRTSWVVVHGADDEIETRNSRYTLLTPEGV